jgi:uncharacterized protein YbcI
MSEVAPTSGQIERSLSQQIQAVYKDQLGVRPDRVVCQFFDQKLAIALEKVTTPSEQLLLSNDRVESAKKMRSHLDAALKPRLIKLIEEISGVEVKTLLSDTDLTCDVSGMIVVLGNVPPVRNVESIPKVEKER